MWIFLVLYVGRKAYVCVRQYQLINLSKGCKELVGEGLNRGEFDC